MGTRFVIIAAPRTGSNWVCEQLRSQRDIWCHGEVFHPNRVWIKAPPDHSDAFGDDFEAELRAARSTNRNDFLERVLSLSFGRPHVGFKIFPGHGTDQARQLAEDLGLKKIVLFRSNFLAVYASRLVALQTGAFGLAEMQNIERSKVSFDEKKFSQDCAKYKAYYSRIVERLIHTKQAFHFMRYDEVNATLCFSALLQFIGATSEVVPILRPSIRGSSDILSRFSNPEVAEAYLREHGLMHWAHEGDVSL